MHTLKNNQKTHQNNNLRPHTCRNCGCEGHLYKDCPHPITSFGIICYRVNEKKIPEYLMIQRKDSLCFMEFIRGKYELDNREYIKHLLSGMTVEERELLVTKKFSELWAYVWYQQSNSKHTNIFEVAKQKYELLCEGFYDNTGKHTLYEILKSSKSQMLEPEWGFPKGRRKIKEEDVDCAKREFSEETGFSINDIKIEESINSFKEIFFGTNNILYSHVYYVAKINEDIQYNEIVIDQDNINQVREVRAIKWFNFEEVIMHICSHNHERKKLFAKVHNLIIKNI